MKIKVTFKQKFRGEVLIDSYVRTVQGHEEIDEIENDLYSDSHVFSVKWEVLPVREV